MTVWLCQCLCPSRHCMLATLGEAETEAEALTAVRAPLRRKLVQLVRDGAINPWCALCGANRATWRYELRRTEFATLDAAVSKAKVLEAENAITNERFGDLHLTQKPN